MSAKRIPAGVIQPNMGLAVRGFSEQNMCPKSSAQGFAPHAVKLTGRFRLWAVTTLLARCKISLPRAHPRLGPMLACVLGKFPFALENQPQSEGCQGTCHYCYDLAWCVIRFAFTKLPF